MQKTADFQSIIDSVDLKRKKKMKTPKAYTPMTRKREDLTSMSEKSFWV